MYEYLLPYSMKSSCSLMAADPSSGTLHTDPNKERIKEWKRLLVPACLSTIHIENDWIPKTISRKRKTKAGNCHCLAIRLQHQSHERLTIR